MKSNAITWYLSLCLAAFIYPAEVNAQVNAGGLGTRVNGSVFGRCLTGSCKVHGGSSTGDNLFHRLGQLDTRSGIKEVRIQSNGHSNVILAVTNREGSFINAPLSLSESANLFVLSPGGLWLGQGSQFNKVPNLLLSTGSALALPGGRFDAFTSDKEDLQRLDSIQTRLFAGISGPGSQHIVVGSQRGGDIVIDCALLSLRGGLVVDALTGNLVLDQAHLHAAKVLRLSGQSYALKDSTLIAGENGRSGPIDVSANKDSFNNSFGNGSIKGVRISGNQIRINAGSLYVEGSRIVAPKGWVELQTTNSSSAKSDLIILNTEIDVESSTAEDISTPQILTRLTANSTEETIESPIPHIGLLSRGNLNIKGSRLNASMIIPMGREPSLDVIQKTLPDRAGVIFVEAAKNIWLENSSLRADASNNLAGYISLEAGRDIDGSQSLGAMVVTKSQLSSSHGAGGGVLLLKADDGLSVANSNLTTITDRYPTVSATGAIDGELPNFLGGQIALSNFSERNPLTVSSSYISASQHTLAGPLYSPHILPEIDGAGFGKLGSALGWHQGLHEAQSGGYIQLYSTAGIQLVSGSHLNASSHDSKSNQRDRLAGTVSLLNLGTQKVDIENSHIEASNDPTSSASDLNVKAGRAYIISIGSIDVRGSTIDLTAKSFASQDKPLAHPLLSIASDDLIQIHGKSEVTAESPVFWTIKLFDKPIREALALGPGGDLASIKANAEARIFAEGTKHSVDSVSEELGPEKSPSEIAKDTQDYVNSYRVIFERVYAGADSDVPALSPWLPSADINPFPPQSLIRESVVNEESIPVVHQDQKNTVQEFVVDQQQTLADTLASLGLDPRQGRVRDVIELQRRLLQMQQLTVINKPTTESNAGSSRQSIPYRPAILQLSLSELPNNQLQINSILLLATGQPHGFTHVIPQEQLKFAVRNFQRQLSRQGSIDPEAGPAQELSNLLLKPLASVLRDSGTNAILLAADRGLQAIPYGALPLGGQPLAEQFALSISPSLGLLDLEAARGTTDGQLLAAGASRFQQGLEPLPMVPKELTALASEQGASLLIDEAFTADSLQQQAQQARFRRLHIATHATFEPGQDETAKLYTTADSISLKKLRRSLQSRPHDRTMDLITLSACHTALGDEDSELGFVGMALQAGSRSAIGTLWEVSDSATAAFFIQFYRYLRSGLEKDQALQATARAFRNGTVRLEGEGLVGPRVTADGDAILVRVDSPEERTRLSNGLRHPHYWAGMVLTGSPW
jgi:filamentous hemagglutinin family protein